MSTKKNLCDNCKHFTWICIHDSNKIVKIYKRIEEIEYKTTKKKEKCEFFIQR